MAISSGAQPTCPDVIVFRFAHPDMLANVKTRTPIRNITLKVRSNFRLPFLLILPYVLALSRFARHPGWPEAPNLNAKL
jgi:hypothetical protein